MVACPQRCRATGRTRCSTLVRGSVKNSIAIFGAGSQHSLVANRRTLKGRRSYCNSPCNGTCSHASLDGASLGGKSFRGRPCIDASFAGAYLREANFKDADLRGANFIEADLRGADFSGADLRGALFNRANLELASLAMAECRGASFSKARLRKADMTGARCRPLEDSDLEDLRAVGARVKGVLVEPPGFVRASFVR